MACLEVSRNQIFQGLLSCLGSRKRFNIRMLKAMTAKSPCRKIPKESIRAPFSQPRGSGPGFAVGVTEMLLRGRTGCTPAASGPVNMLAPLTAAITHKCPPKHRSLVAEVESGCWSANRKTAQEGLRRMLLASFLWTCTHGLLQKAMVKVSRNKYEVACQIIKST